MQNRSKTAPQLPVIYVSSTARYPGANQSPQPPYELKLYDFTFLHFHSMIEIGLCVGGSGVCHVNGKDYPFQAGDVQIVFPFQQHLSKSSESAPSKWYWLNVDGKELLSRAGFSDATAASQLLTQAQTLCGIIDRSTYPQICDLLKRMVLEVCEPNPDRLHPVDYYAGCFHMLLTELREVSQNSINLAAPYNQKIEALSPALRHIKNTVHEGEIPEIGDLPALCGMSTSTFRRKFKEALGISPKDYTTACCVHRACKLLLDSREKIIVISSKCGFENISSFNRCFLKYTGMTPSEYRSRASAGK